MLSVPCTHALSLPIALRKLDRGKAPYCVDHPDKAKIYIGPVLSGPGADLPPGTVAFPDVNNDGHPDMVLTVAGTQHIYLGSKDGFHAPTSG